MHIANNTRILNSGITRPNKSKSNGTVIGHIYVKAHKNIIIKYEEMNYGTIQNSLSDHFSLYKYSAKQQLCKNV